MRREFRPVNTERAETRRLSFKVGARRPNGPGARRPSWIGARSTRAALGTRVDGPEERRARVPAPRREVPRRRKMRFHRVIILKPVAPRGVMRLAIAALPGFPPRILLRLVSAASGTAMKQKTMKQKRAHSRFLPMTCQSRTTFPCEARAAGDTAHAHQKSIEASLSRFFDEP